MKELNHKHNGISASLYEPLTESDIKAIANSAFEVLSRSGIAVHSPTAFNALKAAGADINGGSKIIKLPRSLVEDAIDSNPSSITLYSRNGTDDSVLEKNRVYYGTGGTAIYVLDPDTGQRRPSRTEDVILNARIIE